MKIDLSGVPTELREEAQRLAAEVADAAKDNPLLVFRPRPAEQHRFLVAQTSTIAAFCGNQAGKSTIGGVRALVELLPMGLVPEHLQAAKRFGRGGEPVHGWALAPTEEKIYDSLKPALMKWCPPSALRGGTWSRAFNGERMQLTFKNGNTLSFKCFRGDQKALMPDGTWKRVQDLVEGEFVQTRWGRRKVTGTVRYESAPLVRVRTRGGHDIVSTPNHPHMVAGGWKPAGFIEPGDVLDIMPPTQGARHTLTDWQLGWTALMLGDGCITGSSITPVMSIAADAPLWDELPPLPPNCYLRRQDNDKWGKCPSLYVASRSYKRNELRELLVALGLWGTGSRTKFIPDDIFQQAPERRALFLRWLWGTDGTVNAKRRLASYTSVSPRLAEDVKRLLWSLGLRAVITDAAAGFHAVRVSGAQWEDFSALIGKAGYATMPGRNSKFRYEAGVVRSVERVPDAPVYCVEVDEVHELIVDGVVTSNTYKQQPDTLGGATLHFIWYDEPPPRAHRDECATRLLAHNGFELYTMTPLKSNTGWIRRDIWRKREDPGITVCKWGMRDNPALPAEAIDRILASYKNDLWRKAREFGDFMDVAGLVYADIERCVVPRLKPEFIRGLDHVVGIDPGIRNAAMIFGGFDSQGVDWIYDEALIQDGTPSQYAQRIDITLARWGLRRRDVMFVVDPAARQRSQATGDTVQSELSRVGIHTINGANDREAGQQQIRDRILHKRIYIGDNCVGLRDDADEFAWEIDDEDDIGPADDAPFHRLATLRYQVMVRPFYPQQEEDAVERALGSRAVNQAIDLRGLAPKREFAPLGPMS